MSNSSAPKSTVVKPPADSTTTTKPTTGRKEARQGRPKPPPAEQKPAPDPIPAPEPHRHACSCGWTEPVKAQKAKASAWSDAERQELALLIAEHGPTKGCKAFVEAHPARTRLGALYQHQTGKAKVITTYTS